MILLLKPVRFHGSKHSAGVDVYLDKHEAEQICKEAALAWTICNNLLEEQDLLPLGLAIEGHVCIHGCCERCICRARP